MPVVDILGMLSTGEQVVIWLVYTLATLWLGTWLARLDDPADTDDPQPPRDPPDDRGPGSGDD